jgi:hypothetical protein
MVGPAKYRLTLNVWAPGIPPEPYAATAAPGDPLGLKAARAGPGEELPPAQARPGDPSALDTLADFIT